VEVKAIRSFLALTLPPQAIARAVDVLADLRGRLGPQDVKWVTPENLHITLRFFGELPPDRLESAASLVRALDGNFEPLATQWETLGAFPSTSRAQVIWMGLADPEGRLKNFAREIDARVREAGFGKADKPFRAHVTLGRVRRDRKVRWPAPGEGLTSPGAPFSIRAVVLFKSTLTGEGPIYTPLAAATARTDAPGRQAGPAAEGERG
jgi:2'-5' RNA ligase